MRCVPVFAALAAAMVLPAHAGISAGMLSGGDPAFNTLTNNGSLERAVAEGRIGNGATNGTWELAIWDQGGSGSIQDQAQFAFGNMQSLPFSLTWDGSSTVTYTVGTTSVTWGAVPGGFTDIFIRARAAANSSMSLSNMLLDGTPLPGLTAVGTPTNALVRYLRVQNMGSDFGAFTLTGTQTFSWIGNAPTNSALAYQIKLTNVIPAPASLLVVGLAGLGAARRR